MYIHGRLTFSEGMREGVNRGFGGRDWDGTVVYSMNNINPVTEIGVNMKTPELYFINTESET